jgi:thioredoxin 1
MTDDNINTLVANNEFIIVDVWAEWCGPCKRFGPVFENVSEQFENVLFAKVEADKNPNILSFFGIQHIPTVLIIRDGELRVQHRGIMTQAVLENAIYELTK